MGGIGLGGSVGDTLDWIFFQVFSGKWAASGWEEVGLVGGAQGWGFIFFSLLGAPECAREILACILLPQAVEQELRGEVDWLQDGPLVAHSLLELTSYLDHPRILRKVPRLHELLMTAETRLQSLAIPSTGLSKDLARPIALYTGGQAGPLQFYHNLNVDLRALAAAENPEKIEIVDCWNRFMRCMLHSLNHIDNFNGRV